VIQTATAVIVLVRLAVVKTVAVSNIT